jgi:hypothetical protein
MIVFMCDGCKKTVEGVIVGDDATTRLPVAAPPKSWRARKLDGDKPGEDKVEHVCGKACEEKLSELHP